MLAGDWNNMEPDDIIAILMKKRLHYLMKPSA